MKKGQGKTERKGRKRMIKGKLKLKKVKFVQNWQKKRKKRCARSKYEQFVVGENSVSYSALRR